MAALLVVGAASVASTAPASGAVPSAPELLTPAAGHVFRTADAQVFTVRVTDLDDDSSVSFIEVTNLDTGRVVLFATAPAESGEVAAGLTALTPGRYRWRAQAIDTTASTGAWSESRLFEIGPNHAPNSPVLLLPADGAILRRIGNEPFWLSASDADGDVVTSTVVVRRAVDNAEVTRFLTSPTASTAPSSGAITVPLAEGDYTWSAESFDVHGARSGPSTTRSFTVGAPATIGGGALHGAVTYGSPGLPPGSCEPVSSAISLHSSVAVFNVAVVGYVGAATFDGQATSTCESIGTGSGAIAVDVTDTGATESSLTCTDLTGTYTRVLTTLHVSVSGGCEVNDFPISSVTIVAVVELVPDTPPTDVPGRVDHAILGGAFTVRPQ